MSDASLNDSAPPRKDRMTATRIHSDHVVTLAAARERLQAAIAAGKAELIFGTLSAAERREFREVIRGLQTGLEEVEEAERMVATTTAYETPQIGRLGVRVMALRARRRRKDQEAKRG